MKLLKTETLKYIIDYSEAIKDRDLGCIEDMYKTMSLVENDYRETFGWD